MAQHRDNPNPDELPATRADPIDSPWKELLESHFERFMAFFFPRAHEDIDWTLGWQSLDHELRQIARDAELGRRLADKLIRIQRSDGSPQIVLVHIEIQGYVDVGFAERMFIYNYRVYDRYRRPVVSLALLGDQRASWRPSHFGWSMWGCRAGLRFPTVKLSDYNQKRAGLEDADNPFATVVLAHLDTRATRHDPETRYEAKRRLIRRLYVKGYDRQDVLDLFRFIDWSMTLPDDLEEQIHHEVERLEEELHMPYVTSIERKGLREGVSQTLRRLLSRRFGQLPDWVDERLTTADHRQLETWTDRVLDARTLDEIFAD